MTSFTPKPLPVPHPDFTPQVERRSRYSVQPSHWGEWDRDWHENSSDPYSYEETRNFGLQRAQEEDTSYTMWELNPRTGLPVFCEDLDRTV